MGSSSTLFHPEMTYSLDRSQFTMTQLAGIYTPHMVPLDEDGSINESELRRYVVVPDKFLLA
jgi:hypothetical protein